MDIASLIGLVGTLGMIAGAMVSSGGIGPFIDTPSMLIVIGGTFFAVMYRSTLPDFLASFGTLVKVFLPGAKKHDELITRITELAGIARKSGSVDLYMTAKKVPPMTINIEGVSMNGPIPPDETKLTEQLNREVKGMIRRHDNMKSVFQAWVDLAPAMGMIGTLIGLVAMLGNMADPKAIGPAMAVALLTTLYGAMIANCIFMPIVTKLENYSAHEALYREMVVMGLKYISRGESPRNITDQLIANLPPKLQAKIEEAA